MDLKKPARQCLWLPLAAADATQKTGHAAHRRSKLTGVANTEQGPRGRRFPASLTGAYEFGLGTLACSALLGIYTATAAHPDCGGFYTCTRVTDRTILLGSTATVVSIGVFVALLLRRVIHRPAPAWLLWTLRVVLALGAGALLACYQITQFPSLRAAMTTIMAPSPTMWTASWALWLTVIGLLATAAGMTATVTPLRRLALIGAAGTACAAAVVVVTHVLSE